jgi:hypothetical protein
MATRKSKSSGSRPAKRRKPAAVDLVKTSSAELAPSFAPPGSVVVLGMASPANAPLGFAAPANMPLGVLAPPANVPLGLTRPAKVPLDFAPPGPVVLGFVGPGGVILGLTRYPPMATPPAAEKAGRFRDDGKSIQCWRDDPGNGLIVTCPLPNASKAPLGFKIAGAKPFPRHYQPGTVEFRYWTAAEALRRCADFWGSIVGGIKWQTGNLLLPVKLDEKEPDFNAYYDREALRFFHGDTPFGTIYSGESPDILCHEMGHAVLDAIKPQLWGAASHEAAAFHEAFGDISALLSALQLDDMPDAILKETGGRLISSSLSRLAEQLGAAIRLGRPQDVEPDCLRNAVNSFAYLDPMNLPQIAPASQLSSEPHSFSRVFTGAFFEATARLFAMITPAKRNSQTLRRIATRTAKFLVAAVKRAPVVSNFYAQVAAEMVREAVVFDQRDARVLRSVFARRSILSLDSATFEITAQARGAATNYAPPDGPLASVAIDASPYGIRRPLLLETPSQPRRFAVNSSAPDASSIEPPSGMTAARSFANDVIRRGRVDYAEAGGTQPIFESRRFHTHRLEADADDRYVRLARTCFDCGLHRD